MTIPSINTEYLLDFLTRLLNTPSPTGYTERAIALCEETFAPMPVQFVAHPQGRAAGHLARAAARAPRAA